MVQEMRDRYRGYDWRGTAFGRVPGGPNQQESSTACDQMASITIQLDSNLLCSHTDGKDTRKTFFFREIKEDG